MVFFKIFDSVFFKVQKWDPLIPDHSLIPVTVNKNLKSECQPRMDMKKKTIEIIIKYVM